MMPTALTFAIAALIIALLNIGWKFFQIETDPVRLWVSPSSESARQKQYFDEEFGPFYRAQQVFVMGLPPKDASFNGSQESTTTAASHLPSSNVLSTPVLDWWLTHEDAISHLRSTPNNYTLSDICFAPAGRGTPCVVQSISAWFGTDLSEWGEDWPARIDECAGNPSACLPPFGQPIDPKLILGGAEGEYMNAKSLVVTWVVDNSLDPEQVGRAEEWERELERYLARVEKESVEEANVKVAYSTGVSLEQELNKVRSQASKGMLADVHA